MTYLLPSGHRLTSILPFLAVLAGGCRETSSDDVRGEWVAEVDTIGDTVRVRTVAGSVWGDTARLVPEVTIGGMEGPDEFVFGNPTVLEVMDDGTILVLDNQAPAVRAYAPDGSYLRTLGRRGSGPGEYESPDGIGVLLDGRILVRDPPNGRITLFDRTGGFLGQWPLAGGFNSEDRQVTDVEGNSYVTTILERGIGPWDWRFGLIRYDPRGEIVDTVAAPTWNYDFPQVTGRGENSMSVRPVPFSPDDAWAFSRLGYMIGGLSTEYRIDLFRVGAPVLRVQKGWTPVPVTSEEADEQRRRLTASFRRQYGDWGWNGPAIPDFKPPFKEILVSWEGDLWVVLSTPGVATMSEAEAREEEAESGMPPLRYREPVAFDVFDPQGRYLGPVQVPLDFRVDPEPIMRGDQVWAVTRDELDIPRVVRFRLQRGQGAGE